MYRKLEAIVAINTDTSEEHQFVENEVLAYFNGEKTIRDISQVARKCWYTWEAIERREYG